jgi:hypothetical protein
MSARICITLVLTTWLTACGGGGGAEAPAPAPTPSSSKPAATPSMPAQADLVTIIGSRESPGLHWVIAGDGFTSAELPELRKAALELAREMLNAPELATHSAVWNVHVLEAASRESGVDDSATGKFVNTAFDGSLGCGSNSRVACVDWDKLDATLLRQAAPAAQLTVILNTPDYVGSSNSSGIIVSRNVHAARITVHEMGHRVADLADEYVDAVVAEEWRPYYFEGRFPNVTTVTDPQQVPWRHWLADAATEVGLYEGAFYVQNGFYRPKQDSFMRTLEAPIGQVNAEAWLRAQYRALPPLSEVSPAVPQVRGLAGESLEFSVVSVWPRAAVSLRWFVDGIEVPGSRDASRYRFDSDGGVHEVEVRACDATGRIRATDAREAQASHTWKVSPETPGFAGKASRAQSPASWLRIRVDGTGHRLVGLRHRGAAVAQLPLQGEADWQYTLLAGDGTVLASGVIADPRLVRSALSAPGEAHAGHAAVQVESGHYLIGVPQGLAPGKLPQKLRIAATVAGKEKLAPSGFVPDGAIEIRLDSP